MVTMEIAIFGGIHSLGKQMTVSHTLGNKRTGSGRPDKVLPNGNEHRSSPLISWDCGCTEQPGGHAAHAQGAQHSVLTADAGFVFSLMLPNVH
jgi:hypothetical protein